MSLWFHPLETASNKLRDQWFPGRTSDTAAWLRLTGKLNGMEQARLLERSSISCWPVSQVQYKLCSPPCKFDLRYVKPCWNSPDNSRYVCWGCVLNHRCAPHVCVCVHEEYRERDRRRVRPRENFAATCLCVLFWDNFTDRDWWIFLNLLSV